MSYKRLNILIQMELQITISNLHADKYLLNSLNHKFFSQIYLVDQAKILSEVAHQTESVPYIKQN